MRKLVMSLLMLAVVLTSGSTRAQLSRNEVSQLYVAILGRASEGSGNTYWQNDPCSTSMTAAANTLLATPDAADYFGSSLIDNGKFIEHVYGNTFGKTYAQDPDGINYWVSELDGGRSKGEVVAAIINAVQLPENSDAGQKRFNNRVEVSNYCADTIQGYTDLSTFKEFIGGITDEEETVASAIDSIDGQSAKVTFTRVFATEESEYVYSVVQTADGGYFMLGAVGKDRKKVYGVKTDGVGDIVWSRSIPIWEGFSANSVVQTTDRGYIGAGTLDLGLEGSYLYLLKLGSGGNEIWSKRYDFGKNNSVAAVAETVDGGYIVTGGDRPGEGLSKGYLIKTDGLGKEIWSKILGFSGSEYSRAVHVTPDGGYMITGGEYNNPFLLKTDHLGNESWLKYSNGSWMGSLEETTADGGYIISSLGLLKLDGSGNEVWSYYGDDATSVGKTADGGFIMCGATGGVQVGPAVYEGYDVSLTKIDGNGNEIWSKTFGEDDKNEYPTSVQQTPDGGYIIAGHTSKSNEQSDILLIKTDNHGDLNEE